METVIKRIFNDQAGGVRGKMTGIYVILVLFNLAAWGWALVAFRHSPILLGTAVLAYSFGLRHAFDADHIAAIDNVTRKLMQEGKRPIAAGFFFSLGHSTVVVLASSSLPLPRRCSPTASSPSRTIGGIIGTSVSALFLFAIAAANVLVLIQVYKAFRSVKRGGRLVEEDVDAILAQRGFLGRIFRRALPADRAKLADVSARPPVRPRLRHRHRGRPPRRLGHRRPRRACRSGRSSSSRHCSPPACRSSTPPTACSC